MDTTMALAQIMGIAFTILGFSMLINKKGILAVIESLANSKGLLWVTGLVTLILGSILVTIHNVWTGGTALLITILDWLVLIKGALLLFFPSGMAAYYKRMDKGAIFVWSGWIAFILGLILLIR